MRDRETDSWWSIMTSKGIGGPLDEKDLVELPVSEKTTWKDWKSRHPETLVLSIEGQEHVETNPYDSYFANDETFRGLEISDERLPAKAPVFSFWIGEKPFASPHAAFAGGRAFSLEELAGDHRLLLYRPGGASIFESTRAFLVPAEKVAGAADVESLIPAAGAKLPAGYETVTGFDTFWYNWISTQPETGLLK